MIDSELCGEFRVPEEVWCGFVGRHWEQSPARFITEFSRPIVDENELFTAMVDRSEPSPADRFWLGRVAEPRSHSDFENLCVRSFGPGASDQNLRGYFDRCHKRLRGHPFGVNIHRLQVSNPDVWLRFRAFAAGLNNSLGRIPSGKWEVDSFVGTYRATPFGIHRDPASVFAFCIMGRRRYAFWPEGRFDPRDEAVRTPDLRRIEEQLDDAIIIDAEPGDIVYWPSSYWHVALSEGQPSAVVQLSAYFGVSRGEPARGNARELLKEQLGSNDILSHERGEGLNSSISLEAACKRLAGVASAGLTDSLVPEFWLQRLSAGGFAHVPPMDAPRPVEGTGPYRLLIPGSLTWFARGDGVQVYANGLAFTIKSTQRVLLALKSLARGENVDWRKPNRTLGESHTESSMVEKLVALLQQCRALA